MAVWSVRIAAVLCIWAAVASLVAGNNFLLEHPENSVGHNPITTPFLGRPDRWHLVPKNDHVIPPYSSVARMLMLADAGTNDPNGVCTGQFITHNVILTCAHCLFVPGTDRRYAEGWITPGAFKYELFPLNNWRYTTAKGKLYPGFTSPLEESQDSVDVALIFLTGQVARNPSHRIAGVVTEFKPTQLEVTKTDEVYYYDPIMWSYPSVPEVQSDGTTLAPIERHVMHESDGGDSRGYLYVQYVNGGNANRPRWAQTNLNALAGSSGAGILSIEGDSSEDVTDESYVIRALLSGATDGYNRAVPFDCDIMNWIWEQIEADDLSLVPDEEFEGTYPCHSEDADGCVTWIGQCDPPEDDDMSPPGSDDDSA